MMKRVALIVVFAVVLPCLAAAQGSTAARSGASSNRRRASVTGRYDLARAAGGCLLDVAERPGGRIRFQINCNRGAPSYNLGFIEGTARLAGKVAVFRTAEYGGRCELRMTFGRGRVDVVQTERGPGCGFGGNVYADGRYRRIRRHPSFDLSPKS